MDIGKIKIMQLNVIPIYRRLKEVLVFICHFVLKVFCSLVLFNKFKHELPVSDVHQHQH